MKLSLSVEPLFPANSLYPGISLSSWFNPLPPLYFIGNIELFQLPLIALYCSRKCPGDAILKAFDLARDLRDTGSPVISGFHTPVEKDMLDILLKGKGPIVVCPARGLEGMRIPKAIAGAIQQERLLLLSIFPGNICRITKETAHQRNLFVASLAMERVFIHMEPGGETFWVAEELKNQIVEKNKFELPENHE